MEKAVLPLISYILAWKEPRFQLSDERLTKSLYLIDWQHVLRHECSASGIEWKYGEYGPQSDEILNAIMKSSSGFSINRVSTLLSKPKYVVQYEGPRENGFLSILTRQVADDVLSEIYDLEWGSLLEKVYSTLPMATQEKYGILDLIGASHRFKLLMHS